MTDELAAEILAELRAIRQALEAPGHSRFVSAAELAGLLSVSRDYVYENADRLGAVRLPSPGGKSRLRFDPAKAAQVMSEPEPQPSPRREPVANLLPIGGKQTTN